MSQRLWNTYKYVTAKGLCPVDQWFASLDPSSQTQVDVCIDRLSLGHFEGAMPFAISSSSDLADLYQLSLPLPYATLIFGLYGAEIVLLLVNGSPHHCLEDIALAQKLWANLKAHREFGNSEQRGSTLFNPERAIPHQPSLSNYRYDLLHRVSVPETASRYLKAAFDRARHSPIQDLFLLALVNIVEASALTEPADAADPGLPKSHLQQFFNNHHPPNLEALANLLESVGLAIDFRLI